MRWQHSITMLAPAILLAVTMVTSQTTKPDFTSFFGTPDNPFNSNNKSEIQSKSGNNENYTVCSANQESLCVPYYLCSVNNTIIEDGYSIIDLRQSVCPHYLEVCCNRTNMVKEPPTPPPPSKTKPQKVGCGYSNPGALRLRIFNSEEDNLVDIGEFPWMVALLRKTDDNAVWSKDDYFGGASIIHPSVVMTAAHKVEGKTADEIRCRAGEYDTQTTQEQYPYQERNVAKIVIHEDYYRTSVYNSIALLFLTEPFDFTDAPHMGIGCVPRGVPPPLTLCYSMGWGKEFQDKDKYAIILKKVDLPMMARDKCQKAMRSKTRLGSHFVLHQSLTCAGGEPGKDTCTGDGGAPLVCPVKGPNTPAGTESGRFAIYGMVGYGIGCGTPGVPGIYVNVPVFYDWITEKMTEEGYDSSSYSFNE